MDRKLLRKIGNAPGVPGHESAVQDIVSDIFSESCDEVKRDALGSVIGLKNATLPSKGKDRPVRVMFAAHADEPGMMVKYIHGNGFIHFIPVGGLSPAIVQSQRVLIHGRKKVRGGIVPKGGGDDGKGPGLGDLLIDTGLPKDKLEKLVRPGDTITFDNDTSVLNGKMWVGHNFDNRIGVYCLLDAMRNVGDTGADIYAVTTVQEEVGLRGARPAAHGVAPDIGIAIDGSMTRGAYVNERDNHCEPGKGTGIYVIDKLTIGHPGLVQYLCDMCEERKIPYQRNIGGGTDAKAIQQSRAGVIATTVGAPVRYMHSTVQLCHADDMDATVSLLVAFMETAHEFMAGLPT